MGDVFPPYGWGICNIDSDPNLMYSFTPANDGSIRITSPDNSMFCLIRARGVNYVNHHPSRTYEDLYTELLTPLEKNHCYELSAYLLHNYDAGTHDTVEPNKTFPLKFQVWGGLDSCSPDELLVNSDPISNTSWIKYSFKFTVKDNNYPFIFIKPDWDTVNVKSEPYNGVILMDDIDLQSIREVDPPVEKTVYFSNEPQVILNANEGAYYWWDPPGVVSDPYAGNPLLLEYTDSLLVKIVHEDGCPSYEQYAVIYHCDSVYRKKVHKENTLYYKHNQTIILAASEGETYSWEPKTNLSGYDIQSPELIRFEENYTVTITDRFGCTFSETFQVIADCDTLYPEKSFFMLDTLIEQNGSIRLNPSSGSLTEPWFPGEGLSCKECLDPVASPIRTTLYTARLSDEFSCTHTELFRIETSLVIPNVITPNNDGYNDEFMIFGLPPNSSVVIFTRNGQVVYRDDNYGDNSWWDGKDKNGNELPSDTYWYVLSIPEMPGTREGYIFLKK